MRNESYLSWPFFEERHRGLARDVDAWAAGNIDGFTIGDDVFEASRRLVELLGRGGWLEYAVPSAASGFKNPLDVRSLSIIRECLARHLGLADFAFAMQGLGSGPISFFGSADIKKRFLPGVAAGSAVAAFAITEDKAGSNLAATETTATRDGSHYVIDGNKRWISNTGIADFYVVFACTGEAPGAKGLSAFVVEADAKGVEVSETVDVIAPHPLGSLRFDGCRVPATHMVGAPGEGFKVAVSTLDVFRTSVGAAALGFARRALEESVARSRERVLFDQPLAEFQMTQQKLADMATEIDASALLVYRAAWTKDTGAERITREAAMAKMYATEAAQRVIDAAVQIFGGLGVVKGSKVEELYRDIRPLRIYEGTTEIQKIVIARDLVKNQPKQDMT